MSIKRKDAVQNLLLISTSHFNLCTQALFTNKLVETAPRHLVYAGGQLRFSVLSAVWTARNSRHRRDIQLLSLATMEALSHQCH